MAAATLGVLATGAGAYLYVRRPEPGAVVNVQIVAGTSTARIAAQLREVGVIGSVFGFRLAAKVRGVEGRIQAGRYELRLGMGVQAALDALTRGPAVKLVRVTIPEGYTARQIAARVGSRTHITEESFGAALASGAVRAAIQPAGVNSLEGFLFPETYTIEERQTAEDLVRRMVAEFEERTRGLDWSYAEARKLTRYQALVLASLVEREAKVPEDRGKVAAVIYNRLARGMRLEIDATILYALPRHKVPTRADLRRPSPYNTYLNAGLPPTPIANPGLEAIEAALDPAPIDALYYVVIDPSGRHGFTADYDEFQRLKRLRPPETTGRKAS